MCILVKLVPECIKCGSPVTDSVEPEVEEISSKERSIAFGYVMIV